jgi:drug/metabolite transporter (DMT)-like permease
MTDMSLSLPLICAVGAGLGNTISAVTVKGAEHHQCRPAKFGIVAMTFACLISLVIALLQAGSWADAKLWILGVILGVFMYTATIIMIHANRLGPPSLPWTMANLGLIVPIVLAAIFFNENLHGKDTVSLLVFGGMLTAFFRGTSTAGDINVQKRSAFIFFLFIIFLLNGLLMFGYKLSHFFPADVNKSALSAIMYGTSALLAVFDELRKPKQKFTFSEFAWGIGMGTGSGMAMLLLLIAMKLPATIAFPTIQGVSFLGGICFTGFIFHEKINRWKITGILLGLAVIFLSVWR